MKKKMGCKADGEAKYRSNLSVVRILARHPTKQFASLRYRQLTRVRVTWWYNRKEDVEFLQHPLLLERKTRLELATPTLARSCSTN